MKTIAGVLVAIALLAGSAIAQSVKDSFADFHQEVLRAAAHEAAAVRADQLAVSAVGEAQARERAALRNDRRSFSREEPAVIDRRYNGLEKLRELKPLIGEIFDAHGVPQEFLLVGLVESGYHTDAMSAANAVGMWQFVDSTARRFGLIDRTGDHRTDLIRSTHAAAAYLKLLLDEYNDWRLALAAYNAGEDRVDQAIAAAASRDFSELVRRRLLPEETLNYVPSVLKRMAEARSTGLILARKEGLQ